MVAAVLSSPPSRITVLLRTYSDVALQRMLTASPLVHTEASGGSSRLFVAEPKSLSNWPNVRRHLPERTSDESPPVPSGLVKLLGINIPLMTHHHPVPEEPWITYSTVKSTERRQHGRFTAAILVPNRQSALRHGMTLESACVREVRLRLLCPRHVWKGIEGGHRALCRNHVLGPLETSDLHFLRAHRDGHGCLAMEICVVGKAVLLHRQAVCGRVEVISTIQPSSEGQCGARCQAALLVAHTLARRARMCRGIRRPSKLYMSRV